jgi:hypothetical protein
VSGRVLLVVEVVKATIPHFDLGGVRDLKKRA